MANYSFCPRCSASLTGILTTNKLVEHERIEKLNSILGTSETIGCQKCLEPLLNAARTQMQKESQRLQRVVSIGLLKMPVVTIDHPPKWDFDVLALVMGQSTTGVGTLTDIKVDFFNVRTDSYNQKLSDGEAVCLSKIKLQALECGANAVVGVNFSFSEVGAGRALMIMCMAGTAVRVSTMGENASDNLSEVDEAIEAQKRLNLYAVAGIY